MKSVRLGGVLLAAGASRRMGRPKAFIEMDGVSFLERARRLLAAAPCDVVVVICPPGESTRFQSVLDSQVRVVENARPEGGMLSSLALGFGAMEPSVTHCMVTLVDVPLMRTETAQLLSAACAFHRGSIVVPCFLGQDGHPVIYPREVWASAIKWTGPDGARGFIRSRATETWRVSVDDPGILRDFDTPEDLRSLPAL